MTKYSEDKYNEIMRVIELRLEYRTIGEKKFIGIPRSKLEEIKDLFKDMHDEIEALEDKLTDWEASSV